MVQHSQRHRRADSDVLRLWEEARNKATSSHPDIHPLCVYLADVPTHVHDGTFISRSLSISRSVSVALVSVGASTCWKGEKCWELSFPDLSSNNFVTLRCQLNSQIHLSPMSFNFHTSSTCYSLERFISEHTPRCTSSLAVSISLTVARSGTPKNASLSFMDVSWHVLW